MAKPLPNRAYDDLRRRRTDHVHQVGDKDAEALVASLILRHGSIELDRLSRDCRSHGRLCPLTRLEYELLSCLLLHRGDVWSRDDLMAHVWRKEPTSVNQVAVYVVSLRKKLGPGLLRTVHGQGYTIDVEKRHRLSVVSRRSSIRTSGKVRQ